MIEIEVRNFQSIERAVVRVEGFTALVGRSNIGKSALVRAVKSALTGAPVTDLIRHSVSCPRRLRKAKSCNCSVSVHIKADGFDLLWEKGDPVNRYTFNGVVYDKVAQGTPDFLLSYFAPVKVGDDKVLLQIADQFTPIFLLNQTGTVVADVLSDVARLDRINVAMRNAEKDRREAASTRKVREKDVIELEAQLAPFDGLDGAVENVDGVQKRFSVIQVSHGEVTQIGCYIRALQSLETGLGELEAAVAPNLQEANDLYKQQDAYNQLCQFYTRLADRAKVIRALAGVETVAIPETAEIRKDVQTFERLSTWTESLFTFQRWFDQKKEASKATLLPTESLAEGWSRFEKLYQMTQKMASLAKTIHTLEVEAQEAEQEVAGIRQEFDDLGVCPTCAQPIHLASPH